MISNEFAFVQSHIGPRLQRFGEDYEKTRANSFWALNDTCYELQKRDARWGLLIKTGGANVQNRAADVLLFNLGNGTARVVDVISDAEGEDGVPGCTWIEKDIRLMREWVIPYPPSQQPPQQPPQTADTTVLEQRIAALEAWAKSLAKVALKSSTGHIVCAEQNVENEPLLANRDDAGPWETFDLIPKG
jgi:hypothetical protein